MRQTRPDAQRGFTLIELIVAMVLVAIVVGATLYFAAPLRQAVDLTVRAELTDAADNALQRMARDIRAALPNSVRVNGVYLEMLAVRTAGRYRAEGYGGTAVTGTPCDGAGTDDSDQLLFDAADGCFKPIGLLETAITTDDRLVLSNFGSSDEQNAYKNPADRNWSPISTAAAAGNNRVRYTSRTFKRDLHDSPGKRFFIVSGPVSYSCDLTARTLSRHSGYGIQDPQPTTGLPAGNVLAGNVAGCVFRYEPNVAPQVGLLTLELTLSKARSDGGSETVTLFHAVHLSNVP